MAAPVTTILGACAPGEIRVAAVRSGALLDYALWRPGRPDGVGDVADGRILAAVPAMAGAFVALPGGAEGFLPDSAGAAGLGQGDPVRVRVTRAAQGGKGPRLAATTASPGPGPNPLLRLALLHDAAILVDDPGVAAALRPAWPRTTAGPLDWPDVAVDALSAREVALPGGMRASIHPTPALVAIDVDTGAATGRTAHDRLNRAALPALAAQLRLRSLSGAILVDFAGMAVKRRRTLAEPLAAALAPDPAGPRLLGFTALGLAEIVRPRTHPPLHELLAGPHAAGLAALRRVAAGDVFRPPVLRAAPAVVSALEADPVALPALADRLGRPLVLRSDPALPANATILEDPPRG